MELSRILEIDIKINEIKTSIKFYLVPKFDFGTRQKGLKKKKKSKTQLKRELLENKIDVFK